MDILLLHALILGLVEGAAEFLPISSTGHLIIVADFLGFTGERAKTFEIFIQLGAVLAVVWYYRARIAQVLGGLGRDRTANRLVLNLAIAFVPAAALGLAFSKAIKAHLFNPVSVAAALVVGGIVILWVERRAAPPAVTHVDALCWKRALMVGLAQSAALVPGTSRSGATIVGGLLSGLSRTAATEFSFFLAIPTMFAATLYSLYKDWAQLSLADAPVFGIGFAAAFASGFVVVRLFLVYVSRHSFVPFAWYRIALGVALLAYFQVHPWSGG